MTSDQDDGTRRPGAAGPAAGVTAPAPAGETPRPGPGASPDLAAVAEAMAAARTGVPRADGVPTVPSEDEVATLEQAHETLRTTLDRAERGG